MLTNPRRVVASTLAVLALAAADLRAKPDFSQSTVTAQPETVTEGDLVTFTVRLRNSGDADSPHTEIELELPHEAMFVGLSGFDRATVEPAAKTIQGVVDLSTGGAAEFQFKVIVPRDAGGHVLTPNLRVRNLYLGAEFYGGAEIVVETRRRSDGVALGFWTIFAAMAVRDWRSIAAWHETSCTIRDSRLLSDTTASTERPGGGRVRRDTTTYTPVLALEYVADGRAMVSTGFDTGSRLSIGGFGGAVAEFWRWPLGSTVPCWFDPAHPEDIVVIRGFGGAYLFALFPLPLFLFGAWAIVGGRRRRAR